MERICEKPIKCVPRFVSDWFLFHEVVYFRGKNAVDLSAIGRLQENNDMEPILFSRSPAGGISDNDIEERN